MTGYTISSDRGRLNVGLIHTFLSRDSHWAKNIPRSVVERSIENALCFGAYLLDEQVGFARIVSDRATFAYLGDVFVLPEHRGRGVAKLLMSTIRAHPDLQGLRRWHLLTSDAHELYRKIGFRELASPALHMEIAVPDLYAEGFSDANAESRSG